MTTGRLPEVMRSRVASAWSTWSWAVAPAAIGLASRAFSTVLIASASSLNAIHRANPFAAWDGGWYLSIAQHGYHAYPIQAGPEGGHFDFAFFPGWPTLIRISALGFLPPGATSVLLANLLLVLAAVLLWRLLADRYRPSVATAAVALLAFSPPAYVFSMVYSEPLFLVIAALYFLARARPLRRGLLALLAMLTRIAGAAIVASAAMQALLTTRRERRAALLAVALGAAGFAAWWLFVALLAHDPVGFLHGSPAWGRTTGLVEYLALLRHPTVQRAAWLSFVALLLCGSILTLRHDRELGVYALAALALGLLPGGLVSSMPRYALVAFPAFAGLAERLGRRGTVALVVVFAAAQWFFVRWAFVGPLRTAP